MPVKIRLQRHGKKGKPFYWIVAADVRSKRDGKFLQKLGTYNPNIDPAQITLNVDDSVKWLNHGAQPTETARRILSYKGVLYKKHLMVGVTKGAFDEEEAEKRFEAWVEGKEKKVQEKVDQLTGDQAKKRAEILKREKEVSDKRIAAPVSEEVVDEAAQVVVKEGQEASDAVAETPEVEKKEAAKEETPTSKPEEVKTAPTETAEKVTTAAKDKKENAEGKEEKAAK